VTPPDPEPRPTETAAPADGRAQRLQRQLQAVHRITAALQQHTQLDDLARETLLTAIRTVGANAGSLLLPDATRDRLVFQYVVNPSPEIVERLTGLQIPADQGISGSVFQSGRGCITDDVTADQRHHRDTDRQTGYRTRNMVTVPLKTSEGQPVGVMQVLNKSDGNFDEDDLAVLEILAAQAAFAIELAHLYQQARVAEIANRIGDISHDVKNMITPVVTGAQTLELMLAQMFESLDEVLADDPTGTLAQRVRDACAMVRSFYPEAMLMTYDGIQAAQDRVREIADAIKGVVAEPHFEPTNANDVIDSVIRTLRLVADRQGVTLDSSGLGSLPPAEIDRKHLYNAIYNLINNAIPETPSGGRVYVQTAPEERNGELGIRIVVGDTGRGMPEHVRARLFTPNAISTKPGGTGLGTRIVKNVVDLHHGEISVTSQEGHGTEFTLWLPLRQPQAAARAGG